MIKVLQIILGPAQQKTLLQQRLLISKSKQFLHYYEHLARDLWQAQVLQVQTAFLSLLGSGHASC